MADPRKLAPILVVGSINMDMVAHCPHIPAPGETILGSALSLHPGGKGANGAAAAARLIHATGGRRVIMLGAVGRDDNGVRGRRNLHERGVTVEHLLTVDDTPSGVALIALAKSGENSIIVVPGANYSLRPEHVDAVFTLVAPSVVLMQMEIPLQTVARVAQLGRQAGVRVLLDPAPASRALPDGLLAAVDVLMPNEGELAALTGLPTETDEEAVRAAATLRAEGVGIVVVKRGERGALVVDDRGVRSIPSPVVAAVDTTGAGDCFDGALAVALGERQALDAAIIFATHAAALACTRVGAQEAQPTRTEVEQLLRSTEG